MLDIDIYQTLENRGNDTDVENQGPFICRQYNEDGSFKSYLINRIDGTYKRIYYGGAYVTLDEVAAYLLAFGEVPPNNHYATGKKALSVEEWGVNGRVNYGYFSGNGVFR